VVLVLLLLLIGYALRTQSAQRDRSGPALAVIQPVTPLRPVLSHAQSQLAPAISIARPVPTIRVEASPVPSGVQLRELLLRVNMAFMRARATVDIAPLRAVATSSWLKQEQAQIDMLRNSGQTQHWKLLKLEFQPASIHDDRIAVTTTERWNVTVQTGSSTSPAALSCYTEQYTLVQQGSAWLVGQIDFGETDCAE